jgi:exopolyphosphatase / guanosine-5'-triphosphate,3'-diphosphate pyrophosphatase
VLVAVLGDHRLEPLADESVFLGMGDRIGRTGYLGPDARRELADALAGYAAMARGLGAAAVTVVGTEPMRRTADATATVREVERAARVPFHVLEHWEEGILTLLGVTHGRPVTSELVVIDVGGGSSEVVLVGPGRRPAASGLPMGAARMTQRHVTHDPPTRSEIEALVSEARRVVAAAPRGEPHELVAVGGTASNLCKLVPDGRIHRTLGRDTIREALDVLVSEHSALAAERHGVRPVRARLLPAGAAILQAVLEHYGSEQLRVSEEGIREGVVVAVAEAGAAWRDRLPELASGWRE